MMENNRIAQQIALGVLLAATTAPIFAGPPMITDDPGTPAAGVWEENISFTLSRTHRQAAWQTPVFDNNYNLTDQLQLNLIVPLMIVDNDAGRGPVGGVGMASVGFKYRFLDPDKNPAGLSMSVAPAFSFDTPGHPVRRGVVPADGNTLFLPVELNYPVNKSLDVFAEAGYLAVQFGPDFWSYGLAACWHATDKLDLLAECHLLSDTSFHFNDAVINLGSVLALTDQTNLLLSAGRALRDTDRSERLLLYAGLQFHF